MRLGLALGMVCLAAANASADFHVMKVGEVMLSHGGDTNRQFIELEDSSTENFPGTYAIDIYDAAGNGVGSIDLTVPAQTHRMIIATTQAATALSFTADATLTVALPANGQACFRKDASTRVHCLSWGTLTTTIIGVYGTDYGPTPPDGQSLQRSSSIYGLDDPTPGATNTVMFMDGPPPVDGPPPDAAPAPDGSVTPDAPGGNGNNPGTEEEDGCSVGGGASWFGMALLAMLVVLGRAARRKS